MILFQQLADGVGAPRQCARHQGCQLAREGTLLSLGPPPMGPAAHAHGLWRSFREGTARWDPHWPAAATGDDTACQAQAQHICPVRYFRESEMHVAPHAAHRSLPHQHTDLERGRWLCVEKGEQRVVPLRWHLPLLLNKCACIGKYAVNQRRVLSGGLERTGTWHGAYADR